MNRKDFGELLTTALYAIRTKEGKQLGAIQDEVGYAVGRAGGSPIIHWRRGNIPASSTEIEALARILVQRGGLDREWLHQFCRAAGYAGHRLVEELFNPTAGGSVAQQPVDTAEVIKQTTTLIAQRDYRHAIEILVRHCEQIIKQWPAQQILNLLQQIPPHFSTSFPELCYVQGVVCAETNHPDEAAVFLQKARTYYAQHANWDGLIKCYLELARVHQKKEDFQTAFWYVQEADRLSEKTSSRLLQIALLIRLGELCPDMGRLEEGANYLEQAVGLIQHEPGLKYEEFRALHLLSLIYRQLGRYREALSWLEMAKQVYQAGGISPARYPDLLSSETHLYWYMGSLEQALDKAHQLCDTVNKPHLGKQRIYSRLLLGNLYRTLHQYATANRYYEEARCIILEEQYRFYLPWVFSQQAWLKILTEDYIDARRLIFAALETPDHGQRMSFNVTLAVIKLLQEEYFHALDLLKTSQEFYAHSGDQLAVAIIDLYMAYVYYRTNHAEQACEFANKALTWFFSHNIIFFPLWWHPFLLSQILFYARFQRIHPTFAERILMKLFFLSDDHFIHMMMRQSEINFVPFILRTLEIADKSLTAAS